MKLLETMREDLPIKYKNYLALADKEKIVHLKIPVRGDCVFGSNFEITRLNLKDMLNYVSGAGEGEFKLLLIREVTLSRIRQETWEL